MVDDKPENSSLIIFVNPLSVHTLCNVSWNKKRENHFVTLLKSTTVELIDMIINKVHPYFKARYIYTKSKFAI